MKKVTLLAASVLAGLMSAQAMAAPAEFNGYMRSGVMQGTSTYGHKALVQQLGRLGNENDTFGEMQITGDIAKVDDTVWSVSTMFALGGEGKENNWDSNISNRQFYAQVKGLLDKDSTLWVGKKYIKREDIHLGDFYYYDVSGHGVGVENYAIASGKLSTSWSRKDIGSVEALDGSDVNVRLNVFDARYELPVWDGATLQIGSTYLRAFRDKNGAAGNTTWTDETEVKDAFNFTLELGIGFSAGWNKTVVQSFSGASADCAWSTTADVKGDAFTGQGYRLLNFGETHFTDNVGMFHQFNVAYSSSNAYDNKRTLGLVVRPYYKLTKMTKVLAELGAYVERTKAEDGSHVTAGGQKATLAYAISPDASNFWSRPEIRFYVSYINVTDKNSEFDNLGKKTGHDTVFGAQVEAWW